MKAVDPDGNIAYCLFDISPGTNICGNGNVEGTETCDDGNTTPNDGCS